MTVVFVALAAVVILGVALILAGRLNAGLADPGRPGPPPLPTGPWSADDVAEIRFRVGLRGYRMQDVDAMLAALAEQLAERGQEPGPGSAADEGVDERGTLTTADRPDPPASTSAG